MIRQPTSAKSASLITSRSQWSLVAFLPANPLPQLQYGKTIANSLSRSLPPPPEPALPQGIGAALASFNQADLLRARLACKHWHTSLSRCLPKVTLYHTPTSLPTSAGHIDKPLLHALQPPLTLQTPHAGSVATTGTAALPPQPAPPSSAALPSLLPSLHHITIACRNLDPADLPYLASACPSLSHLTLRPGRYTPAPEPPAPPNSSPPAAPIDPTNPTDPSPANPALLPHTLNSLTLYVTRDTPWDMLQLLTGSAAPQASSIPPSPSPLPVQELCIRRHPAVPPPSSHSDQPVRHASCTVDLTPLLHPQLAGLTFLELATIKQSVSRERGAVTVSAQQGAAGPGAGGGLLGIGGGIGGGLVGLGVDGGDGRGRERDGDAEVACGVALLARLQQLRSLVVADEQVGKVNERIVPCGHTQPCVCSLGLGPRTPPDTRKRLVFWTAQKTQFEPEHLQREVKTAVSGKAIAALVRPTSTAGGASRPLHGPNHIAHCTMIPKPRPAFPAGGAGSPRTLLPLAYGPPAPGAAGWRVVRAGGPAAQPARPHGKGAVRDVFPGLRWCTAKAGTRQGLSQLRNARFRTAEHWKGSIVLALSGDGKDAVRLV